MSIIPIQYFEGKGSKINWIVVGIKILDKKMFNKYLGTECKQIFQTKKILYN